MQFQNVQGRNEIVTCPVCEKQVRAVSINEHLDNACSDDVHRQALAESNPDSPFELGSSATMKPIKRHSISSNHIPIAPIFQSIQKHAIDSETNGTAPTRSTPGMKKRPLPVTDAPLRTTSKRSKITATSFQALLPLPEMVRPRELADFIGQSHLLEPSSFLSTSLRSKSLESMILWGPPGCGKTTLARLISHATSSESIFKELSATSSGSAEVRTILEDSKNVLLRTGRQTTLFLDEIHRFNRAQQDIFLPYVEQGHVRLIGATTENPSFKVTAALLSRCRVLVLEPLNECEVMTVLRNAISIVEDRISATLELTTPFNCSETQDNEEMQSSSQTIVDKDTTSTLYPHVTPEVLSTIVSLAAGDARCALSLLDIALKCQNDIDESSLVTSLKRSVAVSYNRSGDSRYDMISALHKSVRGSDADAALYWLARMLNAGEDPLYIVRRMIVCASEDIGVADVHALPLATATLQACQAVGMPECRINLAHLVVYLSEARKSTRAYEGYKCAEEAAKLDPSIPVPFQMRNAPTNLMKELGYGRDYAYNPAYAHPVHNTYLPIQIQGHKFLKMNDSSDKIWDENALRHWELEVNGGKDWEGREICLLQGDARGRC
ncbi:hypothetical protein BDQ17DRAFT_1312103 [Cyathus striatus]|nr:hypothetical protein BDQ17DRAFT_1312103 [Cyathus striatus]